MELGIDVTAEEIRTSAKMETGKAPGPDGVPVEIEKFIAQEQADSLGEPH